jgi:hypothetical protein
VRSAHALRLTRVVSPVPGLFIGATGFELGTYGPPGMGGLALSWRFVGNQARNADLPPKSGSRRQRFPGWESRSNAPLAATPGLLRSSKSSPSRAGARGARCLRLTPSRPTLGRLGSVGLRITLGARSIRRSPPSSCRGRCAQQTSPALQDFSRVCGLCLVLATLPRYCGNETPWSFSLRHQARPNFGDRNTTAAQGNSPPGQGSHFIGARDRRHQH